MSTACDVKILASGTLAKPVHRSDKLALTKAFVKAQRQHAYTYATEGKKEFSAWKEGAVPQANIESSKVGSGAKPTNAAGFSSPILRPRNPKCPGLLQQTFQKESEDKLASELKRRHKKRARKITTSYSNSESCRSSAKNAKEPEPTLAISPSNKKKANSYRKSKLKPKEIVDSDEEREERLAQRRARRQRKKEIVAPKASERDLTSETDDKLGHQAASGGTKNKSHGRKSKLPAGLALMHGFSAENIGKNRLTVGPAPTVGVFNKGRASTKVRVDKPKATKVPTFDEVMFLSNVRPSLSAKGGASKRVTDPDRSSDTTEPSKKRKKITHHPKSTTTKASSVSNKSSASTSSISSNSRKLPNDDDKSNYESEVWEIEKEFLQSTTENEGSVALHKQGSVVINSRAWDWSVSEAPECKTNSQSPPVVDKSQGNDLDNYGYSLVGSVTTVTPSQSVSQAAAKDLVQQEFQTKSKFFETPEHDSVGNAPRERPQLTQPYPREEVMSKVLSECALPMPKDKGKHVEQEEDVVYQNRAKEHGSTHESSWSIEDALQELEVGRLSPRIDNHLEYPCLSAFGEGISEDNYEPAYIPRDGQLQTDICSMDFRACEGLVGSAGACENMSYYTEVLESEVDDSPEYEDLVVPDDYAQNQYQIESETNQFNTFCVPNNGYHMDYDCDGDSDILRVTDPEYETSVEDDSFLNQYPENSMFHDLDQDGAQVCSNLPGNFDRTVYSHVSNLHWDEDDDSDYSEDVRGADIIQTPNEIGFRQGHEMIASTGGVMQLLGARERLDKALGPLDSLQEAEAIVARDFQKRLYPVKF